MVLDLDLSFGSETYVGRPPTLQTVPIGVPFLIVPETQQELNLVLVVMVKECSILTEA
jgi:hypothetical protein